MRVLILSFLSLISLAAQARSVPTNTSITPNDPLPKRVLDCGGAIIMGVSDRFGQPIGAPDSMGSSVQLNNKGYGVSYNLVPELQHSRVGDHVLVCLVYIPDPDKCPPGDDRGRVYTMTNLRTLESWSLPDSQHSCGGA
jgi:hypothetical protein